MISWQYVRLNRCALLQKTSTKNTQGDKTMTMNNSTNQDNNIYKNITINTEAP